MTSWTDALKVWNSEQGNGTWCIPKKNSKAYQEVQAIMQGRTAGMKRSVSTTTSASAKRKR